MVPKPSENGSKSIVRRISHESSSWVPRCRGTWWRILDPCGIVNRLIPPSGAGSLRALCNLSDGLEFGPLATLDMSKGLRLDLSCKGLRLI